VSASSPPVLRPEVSDRDHVRGPADAPVTLVEYGDFQCPHCERAHHVLPLVLSRLGDRVRFVFRHFPISESHPNAVHAAEAAESVAAAVGEKGFWRMHDLMYDHQLDGDDSLDDRHLEAYAKRAGADPAGVARDLAAGTYEVRVKEDFMNGVRSGVNGTPTFFVNGRRYDGAWADPDAFAAALEAAAS
jgi:formate-nitrite transporter family protein